MHSYRSLLLLVLTLGLVACVHDRPVSSSAADRPTSESPPLILISLDGFHPDYLERGLTPSLRALADDGVRARWMTPSFPSKTFPNHYTIVTGLVPDRHGIVENTMLDPELGRFTPSNREALSDPRWWGGEPIWITAQRHGLRTAPMFWPGSEAPILGSYPDEWLPFDATMSKDARLAQLFAWLDRKPSQRPHFMTLYFEHVDSVGHTYGPNSPELDRSLARVDAALTNLIAGLRKRGLFERVNLILVSDHGMAELAPDRTLILEDLIDPALIEVVSLSEISSFRLKPGYEAVAETILLDLHEGLRCYRRDELPPRWQYGRHPRVPDIVCQLDDGWRIVRRESFNPWQQRVRSDRGGHGFDPESPAMRALFVAHGPAFRRGLVVEPFQNVHVYPLLAHLLDIEPLSGDGDAAVTWLMLREQMPELTH